jgi:hypothetical protein
MNSIWNNKKEKFIQKFDCISGRDMRYKEGSENKMFEKLRSKLGKTDKEILSILINI